MFLGACVLIGGIAAVTDLRVKRIPNWLTLSGLLLGILLHGVLGGFSQACLALLSGLIAGAVFLVFWLAGGMGAGDVKLIAALGSLAGLSSLTELLIATVLIGAVCGLLLAVYKGRLRNTAQNVGLLVTHHLEHGLLPHPEVNVRNSETLRLPYAVPIWMGCVFTLGMGLLKGAH